MGVHERIQSEPVINWDDPTELEALLASQGLAASEVGQTFPESYSYDEEPVPGILDTPLALDTLAAVQQRHEDSALPAGITDSRVILAFQARRITGVPGPDQYEHFM